MIQLKLLIKMFEKYRFQGKLTGMAELDELPPTPPEVQAEMKRRVEAAVSGNVMSVAEARRRLAEAAEDRPDLFPRKCHTH
jgi:hypothetical protein